ncbi:hypothetical protein COT75_00635 [Candidatus Beckwithbacteria bacterium CG10_big_fil_rev_8_21_14_0_10_34_10]|uniref:Membrane protein 6-pyruvoyl-tetrahydropterin synthase-related domain-containing protein n=1 Tax=Candidatus Beckwithbacteria bacterium CG10_big_fil_rev_8_21_14_0_10_34_10 TaxID=1974495 RepID=A0A2H0WCN4_9BACT|nr:MAG: hypothetical protein COT75_00635 [Candidatus Beckwithbacteria bacterium CG10_big_fil_rev_8_21_14_0_10_34_10]
MKVNLLSFFKEKWPYLLIIILALFFFSSLFLPNLKLFYTPDFGQSDIWNFNYPLKDFLSKSIKSGQLPFWSKNIGGGFPLLAEGQIGALNIINLLLFGFFPIPLAWNLSFVWIFFFSFLGSYLFLRKLQFSRISSTFGGIIFSFGGFFVCHLSHFNLIQASSFLPWLFYFSFKIINNKKVALNILFFAFILAQQFFAGHPQMTFICLLGLFFFYLIYLPQNYKTKKNLFKKFFLLGLAVVFGFILAAPQLLPTLELSKISMRKGGISTKTIFQFPYPPQHLITFLIPNYFGTPKEGTYPAFKNGQWGIYWENTAYLGILPLLLLLFLFVSKKNWQIKKTLLGIFFISLLLVLGNGSPLYFVFSFPPFNFFRVPSRFLLLVAFSLSIMASQGLDNLQELVKKSKKIKIYPQFLALIIIGIAIFDLFSFGINYHPLIDKDKALAPPLITNYLTLGQRVFNHSSQLKSWNDEFLEFGWQNIDNYLFFKNGLRANLNLLFNIPNIEAFYGLPPLRQFLYQQGLNQKLLNAGAVKYVTSTKLLEGDYHLNLLKTIETTKKKSAKYYLYENPEALERFRFANKYLIVSSLNGFFNLIKKEDFSFQNSVILEKDPNIKLESNGNSLSQLELLEDKDQKISLKIYTNEDLILVIADSFYPGWEAKIDGQKTEIMPANLNQRAIIIPKGEHLIEMNYFPKSFYLGLLMSLTSLILFLLIYLKFCSSKSFKSESS